ncbi:hypothetical protein EVAR_54521_1 [Eumeta japonica]|uniref:Uncharacterized protein n=1 Tax=Eumeta variegata TaxID=151549 RepID=A0A4C1YH79_EUMVA|nr:hypothetical protein EVAR_54521_1 [Eumeta japonica]
MRVQCTVLLFKGRMGCSSVPLARRARARERAAALYVKPLFCCQTEFRRCSQMRDLLIRNIRQGKSRICQPNYQAYAVAVDGGGSERCGGGVCARQRHVYTPLAVCAG